MALGGQGQGHQLWGAPGGLPHSHTLPLAKQAWSAVWKLDATLKLSRCPRVCQDHPHLLPACPPSSSGRSKPNNEFSSLCGRTVRGPLRKLYKLPRDPAIPLRGICLKEMKAYTPMFAAVLFAVAERWGGTPRPLPGAWIRAGWSLLTMEKDSAIKGH